jgi:hypothetical protein
MQEMAIQDFLGENTSGPWNNAPPPLENLHPSDKSGQIRPWLPIEKLPVTS